MGTVLVVCSFTRSFLSHSEIDRAERRILDLTRKRDGGENVGYTHTIHPTRKMVSLASGTILPMLELFTVLGVHDADSLEHIGLEERNGMEGLNGFPFMKFSENSLSHMTSLSNSIRTLSYLETPVGVNNSLFRNS